GFYPLINAKGTLLYTKYKEANCKINSVTEKLRWVQLTKVIHTFYNSINIIEIARQLSRKAVTEVLTLPTIKFKLQEYTTIANMLFKLFESNQAQVQFISTLAQLCYL
ncbi:hypothetical protein P154DRAFT_424720, partial [Amniculicola lignicola CBS 123094]